MAPSLLLGGGRVMDPASGHDGLADVLIDGDRIAEVLAAGRGADVSVLRVDGEVELSDGYETLTSGRSVSAVDCVRGGEWIAARPDGSFAISA